MSKISTLLGVNFETDPVVPKFESLMVSDLFDAISNVSGVPKLHLVSHAGARHPLTLIDLRSPDHTMYPWWLLQSHYWNEHLNTFDLTHDSRLDVDINAPIVFARSEYISRYTVRISPIESISSIMGSNGYTSTVDLLVSPWYYEMRVNEFNSWICQCSGSHDPFPV